MDNHSGLCGGVMEIAVLMSTYNGDKYLEKQLQSIAAQTVINNLTLYIRDDGSRDDTFNIINAWKDRINIVLYKEKNAGPAKSFWNLLMNSEIKADYYAFCDQDDIWDEDKLERGIEKLKKNIQLYACNCRIINENDAIIVEKRVSGMPNMDIQRLFISGCTQGCSMIFTDELRRYVKGLNIKCVPMHDLIIMLYARCIGTICWDDKPHFGYRVHSGNVVAKANKTQIQKMKTTLWNWKNSSENSMSIVADELISNCKNLSFDDYKYLTCVRDYKKNFFHKCTLLFNTKRRDVGNRAALSYKIRVFLNLL